MHGFAFDLRTGEAVGRECGRLATHRVSITSAGELTLELGVSGNATPPSFGGARVLLLESRLAAETAAMVRKLGGEPISAPAVIEAQIDADSAVLRVHRAPANSRATIW